MGDDDMVFAGAAGVYRDFGAECADGGGVGGLAAAETGAMDGGRIGRVYVCGGGAGALAVDSTGV